MIGSRADIWRQRLWVWAVALAFLAINGIGLLIYKVGYSDRARTLERNLREEESQLAQARAEHQRLKDLREQARINRVQVLELYRDHFSTRRRRLTEVIAEVQDLAKRSGLVPRSISYPEQQIEEYGLVKRSFIFSVEGTYADLRKFINLLEVSESFLTLEDASLAEGGPRAAAAGGGKPASPALPLGAIATALPVPHAAGALRIQLTLSTLFATRDEPRDALAPLPGAGVRPGGSGAGAGAPPRGGGGGGAR